MRKKGSVDGTGSHTHGIPLFVAVCDHSFFNVCRPLLNRDDRGVFYGNGGFQDGCRSRCFGHPSNSEKGWFLCIIPLFIPDKGLVRRRNTARLSIPGTLNSALDNRRSLSYRRSGGGFPPDCSGGIPLVLDFASPLLFHKLLQ